MLDSISFLNYPILLTIIKILISDFELAVKKIQKSN